MRPLEVNHAHCLLVSQTPFQVSMRIVDRRPQSRADTQDKTIHALEAFVTIR
jgi:hypothetical protein